MSEQLFGLGQAKMQVVGRFGFQDFKVPKAF